MYPSTINILATTFSGLDLPSTLSLPLPFSTSISELRYELLKRMPFTHYQLTITTISNKQLPATSSAPISDFLSSPQDDFLFLRLSVPICGGKGGFGSQLRAAGGRMSSRRKRNQGENNGSSRNLDGRRLRTVTEAKALAEYLAIKPEMERREKEQRRKRWEQIVEIAERREETIRSGSKGRVDGKWIEDKDEVNERTREAALNAVKSGNYKDNLLSTSSGESGANSAESYSEDEDMSETSSKSTTPSSRSNEARQKSRTFFGFDDEDNTTSEDDEDEDEDDDEDDGTSDEHDSCGDGMNCTLSIAHEAE